jgi:hypothetical protein
MYWIISASFLSFLMERRVNPGSNNSPRILLCYSSVSISTGNSTLPFFLVAISRSLVLSLRIDPFEKTVSLFSTSSSSGS